MKKILFVVAFVAMAASVEGQLLKNKTVQDPAKVKRVVVWDIPRTDSLYYQGIVPDSMRVVLAYTFAYEPVFMLVHSSEYNLIRQYFADTSLWAGLQPGEFAGIDFGVANLKRFSYLSKKQMKKMPEVRRLIAETFNQYEKFMLLAESPNYVKGVKDPRTGAISVVMPPRTTTGTALQQTVPVNQQSTKPRTRVKITQKRY